MCVFMCVISSHQRVLWTTVFTDFALHFVTKNIKTENFTETVKLFALGLQYLELQRVLLIKSLFCLGKLKSSIFFFLKFLLDAPNLLTIFPLHRLTITVEFFLVILWHLFNLLWTDITNKVTKNVEDCLFQSICIHFIGNVYYF